MNFDLETKQTISNLEKLLNKSVLYKPSLISRYSVGIEIEIKFRYYFPELFKEYFEGKKYFEYSDTEKDHISNLIKEAEIDLVKVLDSTVKCGLEKGLDRYHEFNFSPVYDLSLLVYQIELLKKSNLIPPGEHSLHITIGDLVLSKNSYYILMILQLLFVNKDRIKGGFSKCKYNKNGTWAKKGRAGILNKNKYDLINSENGVELRTLTIDENTDIYYLFTVFNFLLTEIDNNHIIFELIINKMETLGLPNKNWENPANNPDIWNRYIETFDELSTYTKEIIKDYIN